MVASPAPLSYPLVYISLALLQLELLMPGKVASLTHVHHAHCTTA
jgi:hypothetical protein